MPAWVHTGLRILPPMIRQAARLVHKCRKDLLDPALAMAGRTVNNADILPTCQIADAVSIQPVSYRGCLRRGVSNVPALQHVVGMLSGNLRQAGMPL